MSIMIGQTNYNSFHLLSLGREHNDLLAERQIVLTTLSRRIRGAVDNYNQQVPIDQKLLPSATFSRKEITLASLPIG